MASTRSVFLAAALAGLASISATTAQAGVVLCSDPSCVVTDENVLVEGATGVPVVNGVTNTTNVGVIFTSDTDALLNGSANGQADVSATDGLLNSLTFALTGGATFATAEFNLFPLPGNALNEAFQVIITYFTPGMGSQTVAINTNGQNFIGITGTDGEMFTSVTFLANPDTTGIQDLRQLRLGGIASTAVPEPATWMMMLLGFGAIGFALRRRPRQARGLLQVA